MSSVILWFKGNAPELSPMTDQNRLPNYAVMDSKFVDTLVPTILHFKPENM
jgi:hypothetical protein